jgi:DNA-binding CsgD family transcriptional regulator
MKNLGSDYMSKILTTNEWIVLNDIIYKINLAEDYRDVQKKFLEQIDLLIPSTATCFFLSDDKDNGFLSYPMPYGELTMSNLEEYLLNGQDLDYLKDIMISGKCMVYKETDFMIEEIRIQTEYYKKYYKSKNLHYCVQLILAHKCQFMGVVSFYNSRASGDYSEKDIFILETLKTHLSLCLYKSFYLPKHSKNKDLLSKKFSQLHFISTQYNLTRRESEVLRLIVDNLTNGEISERLYISINTLKKHIVNIYGKLGVSNRIQLLKLTKN